MTIEEQILEKLIAIEQRLERIERTPRVSISPIPPRPPGWPSHRPHDRSGRQERRSLISPPASFSMSLPVNRRIGVQWKSQREAEGN